MTISAAEQYLIELINAGRLDPAAHASQQGIGLNTNITSAMGGPLQTTPMQVLAPNLDLEGLADGQTAWMISSGTFGHTGAGGSTFNDRVLGSDYTGPLTFRENLSATYTSGRSQTEVMQAHLDGLYESPSHRAATFDENQAEIGIGIRNGTVSSGGTTVTGSIVTQVFGARGNVDPLVTGVAFTDADNNNFYGIGEALSGIEISVGANSATTAAAGGYAVEAADDMAEVIIATAAAQLGTLSVDMTNGNVKVDVIAQTGGGYELALSGSAVLGDGIDDALLLGAGDLDLTGNDAANNLIGNRGNNEIFGGDGADRLVGGNGSDRLVGGETGDRLFGGNGRDVLIGGAGYDRLYGGNYHDRLYGGSGSDRLYGGDGNDLLVAGNGHDRVIGANGHDRLYGNGGVDRMFGGNGRDLLNGGAGNDVLVGGNSNDRFVFIHGEDVVWDFEDDIDTIIIANRITGGASVADLIDAADIINGNAVFDLGSGNVLTVRGVTDASILADDLNIV